MPVISAPERTGPGAEVSPGRRILLVSYYFGPECETGGLRWNALSRHLAEHGWVIDVLAASRPGASEPYEFHPGVRVHPVPVPTGLADLVKSIGRARRFVTGGLARGARQGEATPLPHTPAPSPGETTVTDEDLYSRIMGNVGALSRWSAELGWGRRALQVGKKLARAARPSVVVVSSPPHPTQVAGVWLSRALEAPLVADMRDPWLFGVLDVVQSRLIDLRLGAWGQSRMLAQASRFVCNTGWAAEALRAHDARLTGRVTGIPNGSDPAPEFATPDTEYFRVSFIGWLYEFMDPEPVLAACARLRHRTGLKELRVEFIGTDEGWKGVSLLERARRHGLDDCFEHRRRVPRDEARRLQQRSAVQVVYDAIGPYRVPAKFYDVVQCRGDLLLLGTTPSAMADAAAQVGFRVCTRYVPEEIDAALDRAVARWRARAYDQVLDVHGVFDRAITARQMEEQLEAAMMSGKPVNG